MACISQVLGSLAPFCCLPRYIPSAASKYGCRPHGPQLYDPSSRSVKGTQAKRSWSQPSKQKANSEDEWEVDDDSEDGSGSDGSGEEPGEEVAAEDSQASNSDASEQVDSEAS